MVHCLAGKMNCERTARSVTKTPNLSMFAVRFVCIGCFAAVCCAPSRKIESQERPKRAETSAQSAYTLLKCFNVLQKE